MITWVDSGVWEAWFKIWREGVGKLLSKTSIELADIA